MGRLRDKRLLKAMFPPMGYESVADVQPTWHVTARAPREYPGAPFDDVFGFWGLFESDFGDPNTPQPYWRVTPSQSAAYASLPFRCPHCKQVVTEFQDPNDRMAYADLRDGHGNYWCPKCEKRYYMNFGGPVFTGALSSQEAAPSKVEQFHVDRSTEVARSFMQDERSPGFGTYAMGLDALGAVLAKKPIGQFAAVKKPAGVAASAPKRVISAAKPPTGGTTSTVKPTMARTAKPAGSMAAKPAGGMPGVLKPTSKPVGPTPAQLQAKVDAARAKLKTSAQKSVKSAQNLKSKAGAKKGGVATMKVANRALKIANKAVSGAQKLVALASKKLSPTLKAVARAGGAAGGGAAGVAKPVAPKAVMSKAAMSKTYMRGLDVLGDGVYIGDDLSDAQQALAYAQQAYAEAKAAADQVQSDLTIARQALDAATSSPPNEFLPHEGPMAGPARRNPDFDAWMSNADKAEADYTAAMGAAFSLIFNDTALSDAALALDDANALVAALEGLPPPPPIPEPTPALPIDAGDTGGGGGGGGGGSGGGGESTEEGAYAEEEEGAYAEEEEGAYAEEEPMEEGPAPSADEVVQRFRESGGTWDPFEEEGQGEGRVAEEEMEEPMETETMSDETTTDEQMPFAEIDESSETNATSDESEIETPSEAFSETEAVSDESEAPDEKTAEDVLGEVLQEALDIVEQYQHQITDQSMDTERTHGSAHRGSAYLQQITQAPHGSSAGTEGGSMRPEETIEVFGAGAHRGLFDPYGKFRPRDVVFHNGEYWVAMKDIAPPWYSRTVRNEHMPGRGQGWRRLTGSATPIRGDGVNVEVLGGAYSRGLDVLGAGVVKKLAPKTAAHRAQIAAAQAKVKKSASAAEKTIAKAVANHAKRPPRTHAGAVKAAQVASARAALIGKRLAKRVGVTKIVGEVLDEMIGAVKPSPKRAQAVEKLKAAAKSVGVSAKQAAEAARAHATARVQVKAKAAARQKALKQKQVFKKKPTK